MKKPDLLTPEGFSNIGRVRMKEGTRTLKGFQTL
jgi:hypothetical protein